MKATDRVLDKLEIENKTFTKITGNARRLQKQMIDKTALREAFINAIVHNDYSREVSPVVEIYADRLTITSYGGLVPGLSREEFFRSRSMIRNREIMRIYRDLDLVEQLGSGMNRILQKYPREIFRFSENFLEVCFEFEEGYQQALDIERVSGNHLETVVKTPVKSPKAILEVLQENQFLTLVEVAQHIGKSVRAVERAAKKLRDQGKLKYIGPQKGGHWEILDE